MTLRLYGLDGVGIEERVLDLLREFDLLPLANAPFGTLSRGQRYKASLVALLVVDASRTRRTAAFVGARFFCERTAVPTRSFISFRVAKSAGCARLLFQRS